MNKRLEIRSLCLATIGAIALTATGAVAAQSLETNHSEQPVAEIDANLRILLRDANVDVVPPPPPQDPAMVELGRNLFFEKEIAGTRNVSCSTCHSAVLGSAAGQSQSRGQGAIGLGPHRRADGDVFFEFLPRNALSLWNRGVEGWDVMFWDGRLSGTAETGFVSPAGDDMPQNFTNVLTAFSIFPVTPAQEMRGFPGQPDALGNFNEIGVLEDSDFTQIWPLVTARVTNNEGYDDLLANAFPAKDKSDIDIVDISEAIGAFMTEAFTALNSPFDEYLAGDNDALSVKQKRGATLFYGNASCSNCHSGGLQTDLKFHSIAAPQVGTGRAEFVPFDLGRGAITGNTAENFQFRTPSLRNIELEGPYMHNGAFAELRDAVLHHINPRRSLANYDDSQVEPELVGTHQDDSETFNALINSIDQSLLNPVVALSDSDVDDIMAFLSSLTDPSSINLKDIVPDELPSGLPLND